MTDKTDQMQDGWKCPECGLVRQGDRGPDPCIGKLPGVLFACCGHDGSVAHGPGYVYFENGVIIRFSGLTAVERMSEEDLKGAMDLKSRLEQ